MNIDLAVDKNLSLWAVVKAVDLSLVEIKQPGTLVEITNKGQALVSKDKSLVYFPLVKGESAYSVFVEALLNSGDEPEGTDGPKFYLEDFLYELKPFRSF